MRHVLVLIVVCGGLGGLGCGDEPADGTGDTVLTDTHASDDAAVGDGVADGGGDADTSAEPLEVISGLQFCSGTTRFPWHASDDLLAAVPDDALTRDDAASLTGLRIALGDPAWLAAEAAVFQPIWRQLEELDGWGTSGGVVLRFDAPIGAVPSGAAASLASETLRFYDLSVSPPRRVAYETQAIDQGTTLVVWPMSPLSEKSLHAVVLTRAHLAADGGCVAPSEPLQALLARQPSDAGARLSAKVEAFVAATGLARDEVSALTLFTTQSTSEVTLAQRDDLLARSYAWKSAPGCSSKPSFEACKGTFEALDYRREGYLGDAREPTPYTLPVRVWLPPKQARNGPTPVLVFGHGLGGNAADASGVAELMAPMGITTVALPAPRHGDHPTARSDDPNAFFLDLLGIDLQAFTIDGFVFRENVRQAAFDKLQMMELLAAHPDIDGDGAADLDLERVAYWGISLGGIMGGDFTALSRHVDAAILSIAGARVLSIVTDASAFATFKDVLAGVAGSEDALLRAAPIAQALVDAGDPVNWGPRILRNRVAGQPPHLLLQMVIDDGTVPNIATRALARAIGEAEQVPPIVRPIDPLAVSIAAPVLGNVTTERGATTAGLFQFDRVTVGNQVEVATHNNVFAGAEALAQVEAFLTSWLASDGTTAPAIRDPYADLETPPLAE